MSDTITVAAVQMEPRVGEAAYNLAHGLDMIGRAADAGARLIVLPELANSGYVFASREEAWSLSEDAQFGPSVRAWSDLAARRGLYIVAGLCERAGEALFNSAVVIGPGGLVGRFRKVHLWDAENSVFTPGDLGFPVLDLPFGRMGFFICYDGWFPESYRALCASWRRSRVHSNQLGADARSAAGARRDGQHAGHGGGALQRRVRRRRRSGWDGTRATLRRDAA